MPSGTGDGVTFLADADEPPAGSGSANPSGGVAVYGDQTSGLGGLRVRGKSNNFSTLDYPRGSGGSAHHQYHQQVVGRTSVLTSGGAGLSSDVVVSSFDLSKLSGTGADMVFMIDVHIVSSRASSGDAEGAMSRVLVKRDAGVYSIVGSGHESDFTADLDLPTFSITSTSIFNVRITNDAATSIHAVSCWTQYRAMEPS